MKRRILAVLVTTTMLVGGLSVSALASSSSVTTPNGKCHLIGHVGGHFDHHSMPDQVRNGDVGFKGNATQDHSGC